MSLPTSTNMVHGKSKAALRRIVKITMVLALMAGTAMVAPQAGAQEIGPPIPPIPDHSEVLAALEAAEALWAANEPASYRITYQDGCFCPNRGPITVEVLNGTVVLAVDGAGNSVTNGRTVEDMLTGIRQAIERPADGVSASFDDVYGHPISYGIDGSVLIADDEYGRSIRSFVDHADDTDPEPSVIVSADVTCLNNDGRVDVALYSQAPPGAESYSLQVGTVERALTLQPGVLQTTVVTGRPDGPIDFELILQGVVPQTVWSAKTFVECDPAGPEVAFELSCLAENGRVDVIIDNPTNSNFGPFLPPPIVDDLYTVTFGSLDPRDVLVAQGDANRRVTVTGRPDAPLTVVVEKNGDELLTETIDVKCDPTPDTEVEIEVSCLAGNGRVDVYLTNPLADIDVDYNVTVGTLEPREVLVPVGDSKRESITGRPDGPLTISVAKFDGASFFAETVTVSCDG